MEAFIYKWDPSFINEDIYVSLAQTAPHTTWSWWQSWK